MLSAGGRIDQLQRSSQTEAGSGMKGHTAGDYRRQCVVLPPQNDGGVVLPPKPAVEGPWCVLACLSAVARACPPLLHLSSLL